MTLSPSESAKGANTPEVGELGALASRLTAGLFSRLRTPLGFWTRQQTAVSSLPVSVTRQTKGAPWFQHRLGAGYG